MLPDLRSLLKCEMHSVADLNHFCEQLCNIIIVASRQCIPHTGYNPHTRPGWTKEIKQLHSTERNFRRIWVGEGRPRGMVFDSYRNYKRAKRRFRDALTKQYEYHMHKVYQDLDEAAECDIRLFW